MVRRIMQDLDPARLKGGVVGIPIVNLQGFRRGSRYLPDRRDLNRFFPGNPSGSAASRIADSLFTSVIRHCDGLVDIHTGSLNRTNLPQLRADLRNASVREFADGFGGLVVVQSPGVPGTLRRAATDRKVPAVTMEAGEPGRLQSVEVRIGVDAIFRLFERLGMLDKLRLIKEPKPVYYRSTWVRANDGGILFSLVRLGQVVSAGDILGTITDPITNEQSLIYSPVRGRVVGMALNQVVMPGFATFNLGIEAGTSGNDSRMESLAAPPEDESDDSREMVEAEEQERPE
jgi:predicted deacylase